MQVKKFKLNRASYDDARWLCATLNREGRKLVTGAIPEPDESLALTWDNQKQAAR